MRLQSQQIMIIKLNAPTPQISDGNENLITSRQKTAIRIIPFIFQEKEFLPHQSKLAMHSFILLKWYSKY